MGETPSDRWRGSDDEDDGGRLGREPPPNPRLTPSMPDVARAVLTRLVVLIGAWLLIFLGTEIIPGDFVSAALGQDYTEDLARRMREEIGLDRSVPERFALWFSSFVTGDFGQSFTTRTDVWDLVRPRLLNSLLLAGMALLWFPVAVAIGVVVFLASAVFQRIFRLISQVIMCTPEFMIAYVLIYLLAVELQLFPAIARVAPSQPITDEIHVLILPSLCLGIAMIAYAGRLVLSLLTMEEGKDYFEFARLKGFSRAAIAVRYALPAVAPSIVNLFLIYCASLLTGVFVIEAVFGFPGLGDLTISSVVWRDMPVVQFCAVLITTTYVLLYSLADLVSARRSERLSL